MPAATKYFCIAEQTAHYLQKYIVVKRRKIFKGKGTAKDLTEVISKHHQEHFLLPRADKDPNFIADFLKSMPTSTKKRLLLKHCPVIC